MLNLIHNYTNFQNKKKLTTKLNLLKKLTNFHIKKCNEYKKIINLKMKNSIKINSIDQIPFLPADIFKFKNLKSIKEKNIYKILNSSGTSGSIPSKIYLDKKNSLSQTKTLVNLFKKISGDKRLPMLILDAENIVQGNISFSARAAGILGFSIFASEKFYALDSNMKIKEKELNKFLKKYRSKKILVFGFTFVSWKYFFLEMINNKNYFDMKECLFLHGGGWKKMQDISVDNLSLKEKLNKFFNIKKVYNYYGLVEQTGSIFFECDNGFFHTSDYNDILIRDAATLDTVSYNKSGLVQVLSILPTSYPGHSILTQDIGQILGENNCKCGQPGKFFKIIGPQENSDLRGCGDTR
jgi:phenylacetate-coenzyme A ligase PaaK-like adenylate-forming protein